MIMGGGQDSQILCQQIKEGKKVETFVEDLGVVLNELFTEMDMEYHVEVFASGSVTWIKKIPKVKKTPKEPEFEFAYDSETKITDVKIKSDRFTMWGFKIIDEEEYWRLSEALATGKRICLHDRPEIGKLLLINFEDEGLNVMDSLVEILEYITEQWKNIQG